jgi:hypothetical protein
MQVQWVQKKKVSWLGSVGQHSVPELILKAKALLATYAKAHGGPVADYGTIEDLTSYWSNRDQAMLNDFVGHWTLLGGYPKVSVLQTGDPVTQAHVDALQAWVTNYVNFPGSQPAPGGGAAIPNFPSVQIPGLPQAVPLQACVDNCVKMSGVAPNSPGYLFQVITCTGTCNQTAGLAPAPGGSGNQTYTPPTDTTTSSSSSALPWIIGGAAAIGLGALIFMTPKMQENLYVGVGATAGLGPRRRRRKKR